MSTAPIAPTVPVSPQASTTPSVPAPKENPTTPVLPKEFKLGNYIIHQMIGRGGFGITYLAEEKITKKRVVIKENYPSEVCFRDMSSYNVASFGTNYETSYKKSIASFQNEAMVLSSLDHKNIVHVCDNFQALGTAYYVMPQSTSIHHAFCSCSKGKSDYSCFTEGIQAR